MANPKVVERLYRKVEEVNHLLEVMEDLNISVDINIEKLASGKLTQIDVLAYESNGDQIKHQRP